MHFLFASSLRLTPSGLTLKIAPGDFVRDTTCRSLLIFHGNGVSSVLESSCMIYTLRFSALASCVALSSASMQSCARCFLVLTKKSRV